jgi:pSer/pThr/pTyr-binding forkhead associated (FHA) protein
VFAVVYSLRADLFGVRVRKMPAAEAPVPAAPVHQAPRPSTPAAKAATRLIITSGPKEGLEVPLGTADSMSIGRSSESGLVIRDDYTSTHHARLLLWNDEWMIQDLDSTNGTFLDGRRVTVPTQVPLDTPIKIGTTTFELRR